MRVLKRRAKHSKKYAKRLRRRRARARAYQRQIVEERLARRRLRDSWLQRLDQLRRAAALPGSQANLDDVHEAIAELHAKHPWGGPSA